MKKRGGVGGGEWRGLEEKRQRGGKVFMVMLR